MKIYCRNYACEHNKKLEKPVRFYYNRFYTPIGEIDGKCEGECSKSFCGFISKDITGYSSKHKIAECSKGLEKTCGRRCARNKEGNCDREEILVDKISDCWACKCQSDALITGHRDWSNLGKKKDMF